MKKKSKHFKKPLKAIQVETVGLPNNVRIGYKDVKIKYVRPDYKKWEMTDCFGEYDYRQNIIQVQHDLCGQEMANTLFHEIMHAAVQVSGLNQEKAPLEKPEFEEAVVNQLTNVMMGVFRDNEWMVNMLKDQLEDTD
jgi:hypothetical protein|tara:strand:- start:2502 stop:2912 length:411 start_codon:yes stop_codon:yes gene_type:complete